MKKAAKIALSTTQEWLEVNHEIVDCVIFLFYDGPNSKKTISDFDIYKDLMSVYFPSDESNIESSTDDITCVDDNSPNVSECRNNEISDNSNAQSCDVTSPEMMNKQALLKELQHQKQNITIAENIKKQNDLKEMNCDNLNNVFTTPVKRKRGYLTKNGMSGKKRKTEMRENIDDVEKEADRIADKKRKAKKRKNLDDDTKQNIQEKDTKQHQTRRSNLDDDTKMNIQEKNTEYQQTKRSNLDDDTKKNIQEKDTKQHQTRHSNLDVEKEADRTAAKERMKKTNGKQGGKRRSFLGS